MLDNYDLDKGQVTRNVRLLKSVAQLLSTFPYTSYRYAIYTPTVHPHICPVHSSDSGKPFHRIFLLK